MTSTDVVRQEAVQRIVASGISRLAILACPWIVLIVMYGAAAVFHFIWGDPPAVTWMAFGIAVVGAVLTAWTFTISHHRSLTSRCHSTLTTAGGALWFAVATITGVWNLTTSGLWALGGGGLALMWNIRAVIRLSPADGRPEDPLKALFEYAKTKAGIADSRLTATQIEEDKATAAVKVPDGKTVKDLQRAMPALEAAAGVPPGSFQVSPNEDDAGIGDFVATDPRKMRQPIPWIGPYRPGGSVADPLRLGLYQDMDPALVTWLDFHAKASGMTGSGKSFGGTWNVIAELMTRVDAVLWGADMSKANQTLDAIEGAFDWVVYDEAGTMDMLTAAQEAIEPRMAFLAKKRLKGWKKGCGLKALFVVLEEAADIFDAMSSKDLEAFINSMRRARSAGIYFFISLQRFDFSQAPTIIRAMVSGSLCFGVESESDADFGLPKHVRKAGAHPERWQGNYPGMFYLVAPGVPEAKQPMPIRSFFIADEVMRAHVAKYPGADRPLDEVTAAAAGPRYAKRIRPRPGFSVYEAITGGRGEPAVPEPRFGGEETSAVDAADARPPIPLPAAQSPEREEASWGRGDFTEVLVQAAEQVISTGHASTAMLQRKLRLPHAECVHVMEALQHRGIVGAAGEDGGHVVLVDAEELRDALEALRDVGDAASDWLRTEDPDPAVKAEGVPDQVEDSLRVPEEPTRRLSPEAAQRLVEDWIRHRHATGELSFTASDPELQTIRREAGMSSRSWVNNVLSRLMDDRILERDASGKSVVWRIVNVERLDDRVPV